MQRRQQRKQTLVLMGKEEEDTSISASVRCMVYERSNGRIAMHGREEEREEKGFWQRRGSRKGKRNHDLWLASFRKRRRWSRKRHVYLPPSLEYLLLFLLEYLLFPKRHTTPFSLTDAANG